METPNYLTPEDMMVRATIAGHPLIICDICQNPFYDTEIIFGSTANLCVECNQEFEGWPDDEPYEMSDVEADADTLASAGMGTDEDYGCF